jgi:hypothetical protein
MYVITNESTPVTGSLPTALAEIAHYPGDPDTHMQDVL